LKRERETTGGGQIKTQKCQVCWLPRKGEVTQVRLVKVGNRRPILPGKGRGKKDAPREPVFGKVGQGLL